jgi:hypothetical protein
MSPDAIDARYSTYNTISGRHYNVVEDLISDDVDVAAAPEHIFAQSSNPILNRSSLYGALTLPPNCFPWEQPDDWLLMNKDHIVAALQGSKSYDLRDELASFLNDNPIFLYQVSSMCIKKLCSIDVLGSVL